MRVPVTGTKMVVHSAPAPQCEHPQHKPTFGQKINGVQCKSTFNQKFNSPQQKTSFTQQKFTEPPPASAFDEKFSNKHQTFFMKSDHNYSEQKDIKTKSDSPAAMALNIPVIDNFEPKELGVTNGECKKLEDLMSNLSVSDKESKTQDRDSVADTKSPMKENDFSGKTESLNDSFQKLTISAGKNKKPVQRGEKENDEKGELIERGPVPSSKKLQQPAIHPYKQKSVLTLSARYSLQSGGVVAEQPCINSYESHMSVIPQTVEEISNSAAINVTVKSEEVITPEILNENFLSDLSDWVSKEIEQFDDSITYPSTTDIQPPDCSEGNTSPHCSRDSTYGTLSPDSNVVSPLSYVSPMSSPIYSGNDFTHETLLNEIVTSNSSSSDSNYLPNEPTASLDLFDLIDDYLKNGNGLQQNNRCDDFVGFDKPNVVGNQMQQFYAGVPQTNSLAPQVLQVTNDKLSQELSHNNSVAQHVVQVVSHKLTSEMPCSNSVPPHVLQVVNGKLSTEVCRTNTIAPHVNVKLPSVNIDQPLNVAYNVTANQFNFTVPNVATTTAPPKYVLANLTPTNHVQPNVMTRQTVYISAKPNNQFPLNIPVVNTASQFMCRRNVVPVMEAKVHVNKPDNSINSFICGDSAKKNMSKSVPVNPTVRVSAPANSVRPVERQILPAGSEVYESGMSEPAAVRLKSLMKNIDFTVQYVKVCLDLANKPDLLKECLFQLLTETPKAENWLMRIYAHIALTVSIQSKASVLRARNNEGLSLLYLACVNHPDEPVIARYIADNLLDLGESPDEIYDVHGNSLVHLLASLGDNHVAVLAELLNVRHPVTGQPVFNVNRPNDSQMETPLHVAVSKHSLPYVNCLSTVKVLITHGANVTAQDKKAMTPLHYAVRGNCELKILTLLLQSPSSRAALDITDSEHNSALHLAAANNSINLKKQKAVISSLIGHGANYRIQNMDGKVPLVLVDIERRQEIKKLFPKK